MAINNQPGNQIDQEIVNTAMPRMGNLREVLQPVIDRLNDGPVAQEQPVHQGQQSILHILADVYDHNPLSLSAGLDTRNAERFARNVYCWYAGQTRPSSAKAASSMPPSGCNMS